MKVIDSSKDLAINGAPPAFDDVLHVGKPNIGDREMFLAYANEMFDRGWLTNNGPLVQQFEKQVADYHNVKHCVSMCNGTVALEISTRALGLSGEVILPSFTFIATAHALSWQGITPVFADIDPKTHNLCPESVKKLITPRTTGIVGVHLWGNLAPVRELEAIAKEHSLKLVFDAAHAFGCSYQSQSVGNFGNCEVLSFHATKFLNAFEGGAVLTNDDALAEKMRLMRNFGFSGLDNVVHMGTNGKMGEIAAAMGLTNLSSIDRILSANKNNYHAYQEMLAELPYLELLKFDEKETNNYQYIVVEVAEDCPVSRDELIETLHAENIRARRYFWPGCHNMSVYKEQYPNAGLMLTNTEKVSNKVIVLPTGVSVNAEMIHAIARVIKIRIESVS